MSTRWRVMRCRSRSIGPSNTSNLTSYAISLRSSRRLFHRLVDKCTCKQVCPAGSFVRGSQRRAYSGAVQRPRFSGPSSVGRSAGSGTVSEPHSRSDVDHRGLRDLAGAPGPRVQQALELGAVTDEILVALLDRPEVLDHRIGQCLLELGVAAGSIGRLEL